MRAPLAQSDCVGRIAAMVGGVSLSATAELQTRRQHRIRNATFYGNALLGIKFQATLLS